MNPGRTLTTGEAIMARNISTELEKLKNHLVYLGTSVKENLQKSIWALTEKALYF